MVVDTIVGSTVSVGMLVLVIMKAMDIMVDILEMRTTNPSTSSCITIKLSCA